MGQVFQVDFWQKVLTQAVEWLINSGPTILVIAVLAFIMLKLLGFALGKLRGLIVDQAKDDDPTSEIERGKRVDTLIGILTSFCKVMVWALVIMLVLRELGVDIAPIIAGAGVAGLAVGFGAQNLVRDVISGFFLLIENQVRTGDVAIVNGTGGLVEKINLRTITLRDLSGVVHIFPNGAISTLSNMTKGWSAMVFDVGVAYKEDTDRVADIMKDVAEKLREDEAFGNLILEPIEIFGVDKFADSAVIVKARIKTKPIQQWTVGREYNRRLKKAFDEQGIEIPFPHHSIYFGEVSKPISVLLKQEKATSAAKK